MVKFQENILLKDHSNFKIGGSAKYFYSASTLIELEEVACEWNKKSFNFEAKEKKVFILGGGTNILFPDNGFSGLVVKILIDDIEREGDALRVGAGVEISKLLDFCIDNSLSGLEWAGGLPGTVGGALRGNAGAYGGEAKDNVFKVESFDVSTLSQVSRNKEQCRLGYRMSVFKDEAINEAITYVTLKLASGDQKEIKDKTFDKINKRKIRHPLEYPNLGSIFKNVPVAEFSANQIENLGQYIKNDPFPVIPTAKLNFLADLAGVRYGDAMLSDKHTNFIINLGNAKAEDVRKLIIIIKDKIKEKFGIELEEEIGYLD